MPAWSTANASALQSLEDTLATTESFRKGGAWTIHSDPDGDEIFDLTQPGSGRMRVKTRISSHGFSGRRRRRGRNLKEGVMRFRNARASSLLSNFAADRRPGCCYAGVAMPRCARSLARPSRWLAQRAGALEFCSIHASTRLLNSAAPA